MKQLIKKGIFLLVAFSSIGYSHIAKGQGDIDGFLGAIQQDVALGTEDVNTMLEGYMSPFMNGFGSGMANGWMNTAKPHKTLGFDLGFVAGAAFVPDKDMTFSIANLNILERSDGSETIPTLVGSDENYTMQVKGNSAITMPGIPGTNLKGEIGFAAVPYLVPQLGIGIIKGTDIKLRLLPEMDLGGDDGSVKVFGIGVMHDVKQYIPGLKNVPFDLSAFVGYTKIDINTLYVDTDPNTSDLSGGFSTKAFTVQALISKKISILTVYGGLGINSVTSTLNVSGDSYQIDVLTGLPPVEVPLDIDLSFKKGGPRMTAGFRLKLAVLTIHADYTLQKYNTLSLGVGFAVR